MRMQSLFTDSRMNSTFYNVVLKIVVICAILASKDVLSLPQGGMVSGGNATITESGNILNINQSSDLVSINYDSFNIAAGETVNFSQPGINSIALNNITGNNVSEIYGALNANGQVFLINPNGILFAEGSQVNVGGLFASTMTISDDDFFKGNYTFSSELSASQIINYGEIQGRYIAFVSPNIENYGEIKAESINLHAADSVIVSFSQGIHITTKKSAYEASIKNSGSLSASGGKVLLTAATHNELLGTVINNDGVIEATGLIEKEGKIFLVAEDNGDVINSGTISTSAIEQDVNGGQVKLLANRVAQLGTINADALGNGNGGQVHLRADNVVALGEKSITTANAGTNGVGGEVIAFSPGSTFFRNGAVIQAKGGSDSGDGGYVDVSGLTHVEAHGSVNVSSVDGEHGIFLVDPEDILITNVDFAVTGTSPFQANASGVSTLDVATLNAALTGGANIEVRTDVNFGDGDAGNITVDNGVDIDFDGNNGGSLLLFADNDIIFNQNSKIFDSTADESMNVTLQAGNDIVLGQNTSIDTNGGNFVALAGGIMQMGPGFNGNALIDTGVGTIAITTGGNLLVGGLHSTNATNNAINLNIGNNIADGGSAYVDIVALNGRTNITAIGTSPLETTMSEVAFNLSNGNTADITNTTGINIVASSTADGLSVTTTAGDITISGDLDFNGADGSTITLNANQAININAGVQISDQTGADDNVNFSLTSGTDVVMATGSLIYAGTGTINVGAINDVLLGSLQTISSSLNAIDISATNITDNGDTDIELGAINGRVNLTASGSIGDANALETNVSQLSLNLTGNGNARINEANNIELVAVTTAADLDVTASAGTITLPDAGVNVSGNISLSAQDVVDSDRNITLTGQNLNLVLTAALGDVTVNSSLASLDATMSGINRNLYITETNDITVNNLSGIANLTIQNLAGDMTLSGNIDLDGANGGAYSFSSGQDIVMNTGATISDLTTGSTDDVNITLVSGRHITMADTSLIDASAGLISLTASNDVALSSLQTISSSLNAIDISATNITDNGDTDIELGAINGRVNLTASGSIGDANALETNVSQLSLNLTGNGNARINEANNIELVAVTTAADLDVTASAGTITFPDAGVNVSGNISLSAQDVIDSDRNVNVSSTDLLLNITAAAGDTTFTTNIDRLNSVFSGAAGSNNLSIVETNGLEIIDLGVGTHALLNTNGNLGVHVTNGDLVVNDAVQASDLTADATRSGMIDFRVDSGDMLIGNLRTTSIDSINTVDQGVTGGLDGNQVSVRFHNPVNTDINSNLTIGDGIANDVVINVEGGDFQIINSAAVVTMPNTRNVNVNSDVNINVYNNVADPLTGSSSLVNAINNGLLTVRAGRSADITGSNVLPVNIELVENNITSSIESEEQSEVSTPAELSESKETGSADIAFKQVFNACDESSSNYSKAQCKAEKEIQVFLKSLLIGGQLPKVEYN